LPGSVPIPLIFCSNPKPIIKIQLKAGGSHGYKSHPDSK
jgi:hypothetical protein